MGCETSFIKFLFITSNIFYLIIGLLLTGVANYMLVDESAVHYLKIFRALDEGGEVLSLSSYMLFVVAAVLIICGLAGIFGACDKNTFLLKIYLLLQGFIFLLACNGGVLGIIYSNVFHNQLEVRLEKAYAIHYNETNNRGIVFMSGLNFAQSRLHCCGITGPENYVSKNLEYPPTCCVLNDATTNKSMDARNYTACKSQLAVLNISSNASTESYPNGCVDALKTWIGSLNTNIIAGAIIIAFLEVFGFIYAFALCKCIKRDRRRMNGEPQNEATFQDCSQEQPTVSCEKEPYVYIPQEDIIIGIFMRT